MATREAARLARAIRARRDELGLTQMGLHDEAIRLGEELSIQNIRVIEQGRRLEFRRATARALYKALRWPSYAFDHIREGGDPSSLETVRWESDIPVGLSPEEREIWELGLPEETRRALIAHLRERSDGEQKIS